MTETWTARVRIGGITEGNPPMLAFSEIATRSDGKRKLISQMAQVGDAALLARLRREVRNGDEAEVVIEQHISSSVLKDFSIISASAPVIVSRQA